MIELVKRVGGIQPGKQAATFDRLTDASVFRDAIVVAVQNALDQVVSDTGR